MNRRRYPSTPIDEPEPPPMKARAAYEPPIDLVAVLFCSCGSHRLTWTGQEQDNKRTVVCLACNRVIDLQGCHVRTAQVRPGELTKIRGEVSTIPEGYDWQSMKRQKDLF